jgi:phosphatidylinositol 4-kinase A
MRSLLSHSIQITFFYVPQLVQALRYDELGYVEQFILETSLLSPLFAHQIIWSMKANAYRDEDSTIPDPLKPSLDRLTQRMIDALSGQGKDFYEREFSFFNEVTSISGKLKPYIKHSKAEKKAKIDEEMKKIKLDVGVYLPSNPDGDVIGIDRKSGRPLQSHAKAPFMATFKIRRVTRLSNGDETLVNGEAQKGETVIEVMQSAIFKVGDDCRQDVLALQLISTFRNIFNRV